MRMQLDFMRRITLAEASAICLLLVASLGSAYYASKILSMNPDALISVFLFKHGAARGDLLIADWHTNLLKWPLLWVQARVPFTFTTFIIANALLSFVTLLGWAVVSGWALGRKYFPLIAGLLAILAAGSSPFVCDIAFTTIRNIDYPLYFALLVGFWRLAPRLSQSPTQWWAWTAAYTFGMSLLIASDPFFGYMSIPALIIMTLCSPALRPWRWQHLVKIWLLIGLPYLVAHALLWALQHWAVFQYYGESFSPPLQALSALPGAAWHSVHDLLTLFEGNIFGQRASEAATYLPMLLLLASSLSALVTACKSADILRRSHPAFLTLLLSALLSWAVYVGSAGMEGQYRFLMLLAFTLITALGWWLQPKISHVKPLFIVAACAALSCIVGVFCVHHYRITDFENFSHNKTNMQKLSEQLHSQGVRTVVSGHTYASLLRFWSQDTLRALPVLYCNQNLPFLTRASWYQPQPGDSETLAIIVDRQGRDANSWQCSKDSFIQYYGAPTSQFSAPGLGQTTVEVYLYPKETLQKIHFITTPGTPRPSL